MLKNLRISAKLALGFGLVLSLFALAAIFSWSSIFGVAAALELKKRIYMNEGVRLIGVTASNLAPPLETVDLFSTVREKQVKAAAVMDAIQEKFGEHALRKGFWLEEEKRKEMEEKEKENKEAPEEE